MNSKQYFLWFIIFGIASVIVSSTITIRFFKAQTIAEPPAPALPVSIVQVASQESYKMERKFTGVIQPRRDSVLGFEHGGKLTKVFVDVGDVVEKGEVLAELDTDNLRSRKAEMVATEIDAKAKFVLTEITLQRIQSLEKDDAVSKQELDVAINHERSARAALSLARQRIKTIATQLGKSQIHAPFSGNIVERKADEGRVLDAGEPVVRLQSNTSPEIRIGIAGLLENTLIAGQTYMLEWQGQVLRAQLRNVLPLRSISARTVDVLFDPLDNHNHLKPGDLITLQLATHITKSGIWLPITALTQGERGLWSVYVAIPISNSGLPAGLYATHRLKRHTVDLIYQKEEQVYVTGGLKSGDHVVITGLQRLVPDQWVRAISNTIVQEKVARD